ncbi:MAG: FliI/YscN family ATPase [Myxococcota bacterium]|nr:FliI/YscN family ATPase [Myxococcota bacterium]
MIDFEGLQHAVNQARLEKVSGRVVEVVGTLAEAEIPGAVVGGLCRIGEDTLCEVVGFRDRRALLMPLESLTGVSFGSKVSTVEGSIKIHVGDELVGRILDGLGRPMDDGPSLRNMEQRRVEGKALDPLARTLIEEPLETGVRVLDGMLTVGKGQRIAVMSGSGVGKSTLMGMLARNVQADINVICLVGERGREVREFIERDLGPEGLARSVLVVVTSDRSPVLQVKGAFVAAAIAEHFRDQGKDVLMMMDSLTRFAMAQRQIGLAAGEPPTTKGYTPSVFGLLPKLLERVGPGTNGGSITGIFTVLVEGDDIHDPIGDAVRGIVDGHVVLSRKLASHGHYPAVDVLQSLSRVMVSITKPEHQANASKMRALLATWAENEELIRLGAYRKGSSPEVDEAIDKHEALTDFLKQGTGEVAGFVETLERMGQFRREIQTQPIQGSEPAPALGKKLGVRAGGFYSG